MNKIQKILLFVGIGLLALLLTTTVYFIVATGGRPAGKSEVKGLVDSISNVSKQITSVEAKANEALENSNNVALWISSVRKDDSTQVAKDLAATKKRIDVLAGSYNASQQNKKEIEKLKALWQNNIKYMAQKDSASRQDLSKVMSRIDSIAVNKTKPALDGNGGQKPNSKKVEIPDGKVGNGQTPPDSKDGKKEYKPKNNKKNKQANSQYQNYNKSKVE